jgi:hypothetical protein
MAVTRTLNPLPFHDLEPRRFEDLIRQLVYDFRPWLRLEATGRAGSDDGFDVRGIEPGETQLVAIDPDDENPDSEEVASANERIWLIQCKRERKIGPSQLQKYLDEIAENERSTLYGIIFAACCDFSKRARDVMAKWCRENNLAEFQIWSVSDIETMLLQPKNDHLLFAFFGLSLQIRKRSLATAIRSRIATKKKIERVLRTKQYAPFLLRDPETPNYPYVEEGKKLRWYIRENRGFDFRGVGFLFKEYFAYANDRGEWDMANAFNRAIPEFDNPWLEFEDRCLSSEARAELRAFHSSIDTNCQSILTVIAYIPFEEIVAIDEVGDEFNGTGQNRPTIYVSINDEGIIAHVSTDVSLSLSRSDLDLDKDKRIKFFPDKFRRDGMN